MLALNHNKGFFRTETHRKLQKGFPAFSPRLVCAVFTNEANFPPKNLNFVSSFGIQLCGI